MTKYGRITSSEKHIPEDEPVFVLRGKDVLAPLAVEAYAQLLRAAGNGIDQVYDPVDLETDHRVEELLEMADEVSNVAAEMIAWQSANGARLPD